MKKVFILLIIFVTTILITTFLQRSRFNNKNKFAFIEKLDNGDIKVTVLDPQISEKTQITIPADTEVEVSRNYGFLRLKNVWQLGINEKIGPELLLETITKNFHFPVSFWWNKKESNINLVDKIRFSIFMKKLNQIDINQIDMGKSLYLKKTKLTDGEDGFKLIGDMSPRLTAYFSDNSLPDNLKIKIVDSTGKSGISEKLGAILEVIGGKVVSIEKKDSIDMDCEVLGVNAHAVDNVSDLFHCKKVSGKSNYDLEVKIGKIFSSRF